MAIRDEHGAALPGAKLVWADERAVVRLQHGASEAESFAERLEALGSSVHGDARGEVALEVVGGFVALHGTHGALAGSGVFPLQSEVKRVDLVLRSGDLLVIQAVTATGEPAAGVPLVARWLAPLAASGGWGVALGATDAEGRLEYPSWHRLAEAAGAPASEFEPVARVGPGVLGVRPEAFVEIAKSAGPPRRIVVPKYETLISQLANARGELVDWSGVIVELGQAGQQPKASSVTRDGIASHPVVSGMRMDWAVRSGSCTYGEGQVDALGLAEPMLLRCGDIVTVTGEVVDATTGFAVVLQPRWRARQVLAIPAGQQRFAVSVGRHEGIDAIEFQAGADATVVSLPDLVGDTVDLGQVILRGVPFADLEIVDDRGECLGEIMIAAFDGEQRVPVRIRRIEPGRWRLDAIKNCSALRCVFASTGCIDEIVGIQSGERRRVVMRRFAPAEVVAGVPPGVEIEHLRLRIVGRWSEAHARWDLADDWYSFQRNEIGCRAAVKMVRQARHKVQLWSVVPPACVGEAEWVAGGENQALDGSRLRNVTAKVDGSGTGYWLAAGSQWATGVRGAQRAVARVFGVDRWLVAAEEHEVLLMGERVVPAWVSVMGPAVSVVMEQQHARSLRGLVEDHEVEAVSLTSIQLMQTVEKVVVSGVSPARTSQLLAEFGMQVLLPCDYLVRCSGRTAVAHWQGGRWQVR